MSASGNRLPTCLPEGDSPLETGGSETTKAELRTVVHDDCQMPSDPNTTANHPMNPGNKADSDPQDESVRPSLPQTTMQIVDSLEVRPQPTEEARAEMVRESARLEGATPFEILRWGLERYQDRFTFATAFGPEGMVIIHYLAQLDKNVRIFNLDTGYQFQETLDLRDRVAERYGIEVELVKPELSVEEYEAANGGPVYKTDPSRCCGDRKLTVLRRALSGMEAWGSAIRRDQSPDRAKAPIVGWDAKFSLVKISPLANSTKRDIWKLITDENIPYNPLHDQGYPSVGCWPCTRAVTFGEDERAGRWSGTQKTECGLHSLDEDGTTIAE